MLRIIQTVCHILTVFSGIIEHFHATQQFIKCVSQGHDEYGGVKPGPRSRKLFKIFDYIISVSKAKQNIDNTGCQIFQL